MREIMNSAAWFLEDAAENFSENIAFEDSYSEISFRSLREKSRALASGLLRGFPCKSAGAKPPVMIYLPKSINCIISFFGVLYTGAPYAPMNYDNPLDRIKKMAETLDPSAIITDSAGAEKLEPLGLSEKTVLFDSLVQARSDDSAIEDALKNVYDIDPAYIMFTSGSTGVPKGVTVSGRNLVSFVKWYTGAFDFNERDTWGLAAPFHFDSTIADIYSAVYKGSKVCIIPETLFRFPDKLMEYVKEKEISCIQWVPTTMNMVANSGVLESIKLPKLRYVLFGAEAMPNKQLNIWRRNLTHCKYANLYGPTEATVYCAYFPVEREFDDAEPLPIGHAAENARLFILNDENKPCAANEIGELYIGGTSVVPGYWNEPELTKAAFIQNPLNTVYSEIIYRTGDLAYENDRGEIVFVGRSDSQIKMNGIRIELGDVERAASVTEGVESVCALFDDSKKEIVLFAETDGEISERKFKMALKNHMPSYMIPKRIITMKKLPHTPNGKIDRVGLKAKYINNQNI